MKIHAIGTVIFIICWTKLSQDFVSSEPVSTMGTLKKRS